MEGIAYIFSVKMIHDFTTVLLVIINFIHNQNSSGNKCRKTIHLSNNLNVDIFCI